VAQGRVEIRAQLLATRYGQLSAAVAGGFRGHTADLDAIAQRVLTAQPLMRRSVRADRC